MVSLLSSHPAVIICLLLALLLFRRRVLLLFLLFGTVFFATYESCACSYGKTKVEGCVEGAKCAETGGQTKGWVDAFYMSVITLTTVGFGDFSPIEDWEKVYKSVMMLVGIPVFATCLGNLTHFLFAEGREGVKLRLLKGGLTPEKFEKFQEFSRKLDEIHAGDDTGDDRISRFEFLTFVLVENGVIELKNITNAMKNFNEIDKTNTGFIEKKDLELWMQEHEAELKEDESKDFYRIK